MPYGKMKDIILIIPAYEPDESFILLCKSFKDNNIETIIVDDGSETEKYGHIFSRIKNNYGFTVIKHAVNLGKGRALKDAFNYCLNSYPKMTGVITADSDGQHSIEDICRCMNALRENPDKLILGCRNFSEDYIPWKSKFGNQLTKKICKYLCGIEVTDTQTGLRGIPKSFLKVLLETEGERFEYETNMLITAVKGNFDFFEIPIRTIYESKDNHQTHFDPIIDSIKIYKIFGKIFLKYVISSFSSCVLDLCVFTILIKRLSYNAHAYVVIATIIARIFSGTYNYVINYKLVFNSNKKKLASSSRYLFLVIIQMLFSAILVTIGTYVFPLISATVIKIVIDTLLFFVSYKIQQKYVF